LIEIILLIKYVVGYCTEYIGMLSKSSRDPGSMITGTKQQKPARQQGSRPIPKKPAEKTSGKTPIPDVDWVRAYKCSLKLTWCQVMFYDHY